MSFLLVSFFVAIFSFLSYYFLFAVQRPQIYGSNVNQVNFLKKLQVVGNAYYPTPFYFNGVLQTIFGLSKRLMGRLPYDREIITLKDGGQLALDFLQPSSTVEKSDSLVILFPGVTSSSQTSYMKTLALACVSTGAEVVVMNNRGLGGVPLSTPRLFCATKVEDIKEVLDRLFNQFPFHQKVAIGTSFGGILLGQYLFRHGKEAKENLSCAVLISTPWDMHALTASLAKPLNNYFFNLNIGGSLKSLIKRHQKMMHMTITDVEERLERVRTLLDFSILFMAPSFNYKDVNECYNDMGLTVHIQEFTIPVFALNAADDPLQPEAALPLQEACTPNSKLTLIVTARGGHLGFLEGLLPIGRPVHYMERFVQEFLIQLKGNRAMLNISNSSKDTKIVETHANKLTIV